MSDQDVSTSGEWRVEDWKAMAERLRTFWPKDSETGQPLTQNAFAGLLGMHSSTLGDIVSGREMKMRTHQKIIFWLIQSGYTAEDVLWWQSGYREDPQRAAGGITHRWKHNIGAAIWQPLSAISLFIDA